MDSKIELYIRQYIDKTIMAYEKHDSLILLYDFDDTVKPWYNFSTDYTIQSKELIKRAAATGKFKFILNTCREDKRKLEALLYCEKNGLPFDAVNKNISGTQFEDMVKPYCNLMLDDKSGSLPISLDILDRVLTIIENKK